MTTEKQNMTCTFVCWVIAAIVGLIAFYVLKGALPGFIALVIGAIIAVVLGLWMIKKFCISAVRPAESAPKPTPAPEAPAAAPAAETVAEAAPEPAPEPKAVATEDAAAEDAAKAEDSAPAVKSGTQLPGQEELAARKGEWKYEAPAKEASAEDAPEEAPADAPVAATSDENAAEDAGEAEPEVLTAARDGAADDLKKIKGVGPKLEQTLNELGFFHYDQIAKWTEAEIAWVDNRLKFKGRIQRDDWIAQAKDLAGK